MASGSSETPISPVSATRPQLTISAAAINDEPVELDSTPVYNDKVKHDRRGSKAIALAALAEEKGLSDEERQRREKLILERKSDPAVLVDIPQAPAPDELEKAGAAEDESQKANS